MIIRSDFKTCALTLLNRMEGKKGVQYVLVQKTPDQLYILYGLEDPSLDWSKAASREMRVVLCANLLELHTLLTLPLPTEDQ